MKIRIDPESRVPLSVQLRDAIAVRIAAGRLAPGERIPSVRRLAAEHGLAPNTVAKAYRELESGGYLVGRGRLGTFVAEVLPKAPEDGEAGLEHDARAFAKRARQLGVPRDRALAVARRALQALEP